MDVRSYFPLFPQAPNGYQKEYRQYVLYISGDTSFYFLRQATSLYSLMLLMDMKRNIDSTSHMDLRRYFPVNLRAGNYRIFSPMFHEVLFLLSSPLIFLGF